MLSSKRRTLAPVRRTVKSFIGKFPPMPPNRLKPGKLHPDLLARLLRRNPIRDPRVLIGPGVGLDVAVINQGKTCLVATSDPVTFATDAIGRYAVNVNANDIATAGAQPTWFLATLLLPEKNTTPQLIQAIYDDLQAACADLGVTLVGGHTEITLGLDRPILAGCMLGEVPAHKLVRADGARPGDRILLTKRVAVEGTALLGLECAPRLAAAADHALVKACAAFLHSPGISVVPDARAACRAGGVHAMHDPTEGGLATGIAELARAAGCGAIIAGERIPLYPETARACDALGLDPLGLIASGSLLIAAAPARAGAIIAGLAAEHIECADIGEITPKGTPCRLATARGERDLPVFERDEIARLFSAAPAQTSPRRP